MAGRAGQRRQLLVRLHPGAGEDLPRHPAGHRGLRRDAARHPHARQQRPLVVPVGVGEPLVVDQRGIIRVGGRQTHPAAAARPGDVGRHRYAPSGGGVPEPLGMHGEGHQRDVGQHVGDGAGRVRPVHDRHVPVGRALRRERAGRLPDDQALRVVAQVAAHAGGVGHHLDAEPAQVPGRTDAGQHQQPRRVDRPAAHDHLAARGDVRQLAVLPPGGDPGGAPALAERDPQRPGSGQHVEVVPPAHDRVQVGDRRRGADAGLRVVAEGQEAGAVAVIGGVPVLPDRDAQGGRGGLDDVGQVGVAVTGGHRDDADRQPAEVRAHRAGVPAARAQGRPAVEVRGRWQQRDHRVVR